jgi:ESF2/ABP1 family protein
MMKCITEFHSVCIEDAKRAYLRKKYTSTKKPHFTEGWVEFKDKHVARSVANMLNATPIGGKKGSRWRDDVWTMKYLPRFKWYMLTEQIGASLLHLFGCSYDDFPST